MIVSPYMLQVLITELQLHQKKLNNITKNADQLNSLVKHINSEEKTPLNEK
jgi:NAD-dependent SIR2 family protein deacetylase